MEANYSVAASIVEHSQQVMTDAMSLDARLRSVERFAGCAVEQTPTVIADLRAQLAKSLGDLADMSARKGKSAAGSDLVNAAMAAAAIHGTHNEQVRYLELRGWRTSLAAGWDHPASKLTLMPLDGALNVQTRRDCEPFSRLLR